MTSSIAERVWYPRRLTPAPGSFFLFGPRGTGKTAWLRATYPDPLWLDLLDPARSRELSASPERLLDLARGVAPNSVIVIDEIQRVPELLPAVHLLMDERPSLRFVLTGSSARKLKRSGVDLLAGRAVKKEIFPFIAEELGSDFRLDSALRYGTIPLVLTASDPGQVLASYVALYVREEVQAEALVRNIPAFHRFLEAVSLSHGSVLNMSGVSREAQIERKVVENYLTILEDLLLAFRVPVFSRRARRSVVAHPKFYFVDPGVFASLRPHGPLDAEGERLGSALEGLVATHLRAWIAYSASDAQISYWRTPAGLEVDFIVYGSRGLRAIEVKSGERVHPSDVAGLRAFRDDYPEADCLLLYRGRDRFDFRGIPCLPIEGFLRDSVHGGV